MTALAKTGEPGSTARFSEARHDKKTTRTFRLDINYIVIDYIVYPG